MATETLLIVSAVVAALVYKSLTAEKVIIESKKNNTFKDIDTCDPAKKDKRFFMSRYGGIEHTRDPLERIGSNNGAIPIPNENTAGYRGQVYQNQTAAKKPIRYGQRPVQIDPKTGARIEHPE